MSQDDRPDDRRAVDRRTSQRRAGKDEASTARETGRALMPGAKLKDERVDRPASPAAASGPDAAFAAQIIGQGGQRNGIRGGPPVMDGARSAYLGAEYSGDKERRPPVGKAKRTDI